MSREGLQLSYELSGSDKNACCLPVRGYFQTCQFKIMVACHLISVYDDFTCNEVVVLQVSCFVSDRLSYLFIYNWKDSHLKIKRKYRV